MGFCHQKTKNVPLNHTGKSKEDLIEIEESCTNSWCLEGS